MILELDAESQELDPPPEEALLSPSEKVVDLNVGGMRFTTSLATLCKYKDSMLSAMFSGNFEHYVRDSDGRVFIDRNGNAFAFLLEFLRTGVCFLPHNAEERSKLLLEADYYGLKDHLLTCDSKFCSNILSNTGFTINRDSRLYDILVNHPWKVIYQASQHGFKSNDFHREVDSVGPTIVLIKTATPISAILGVYTSIPWSSIGGCRSDANLLCFRYSQEHGDREFCEFNLEEIVGGNYVYQYGNWGPAFGKGPALFVCSESNKQDGSNVSQAILPSLEYPEDSIVEFRVEEMEVLAMVKADSLQNSP